jgi:hypothetical protein
MWWNYSKPIAVETVYTSVVVRLILHVRERIQQI